MGTRAGTPYKVGRWFDRGADALAEVLPGLPYWGYLCPLCLRLYSVDDAGQLTVDHVPAEALGGQRLVLTCECNHRAGHDQQSHALNREIPLRAFRGELREPHPVTLKWQDGDGVTVATLRVRMFASSPSDVMSFTVVEEANHRDVIAELKRLMTAAEGRTDWSIVITFDHARYHPVASRVAMLRDAYLVAFAQFGYRYILSDALAPVREQLKMPRVEQIKRFMTFDAEADPSTRRFWVIEAPEHARSVLVQVGRTHVFLPHPEANHDIYAALLERPDRERVTFHGTEWEWPREPRHGYDLPHQKR